MKTVAYLRVSTNGQELASQRLPILDYARENHFSIDEFVEVKLSTRRAKQRTQVLETIDSLEAGDRFIVSELSRLGRSLGQIIHIVDDLLKKEVKLVAIKESIRFDGKPTMQTKVMIALFGLFAEIERDLISERTKEGLAAAREKGKLLGRPKGTLGKSKLDGRKDEIVMLLQKDVSKASIAKIMEISPTTLHHFIKTRKLAQKDRHRS